MSRKTTIDDVYENILNSSTFNERKILGDIFRNIKINRRNLTAIIRILNEYISSLNLLIYDFTLRRRFTNKFIHPIDFSEIFSYMHKDHLNSAYGNMLDYAFKNKNPELQNRFFTLLPGTIFEIVNHIDWLNNNVGEIKSNIDYEKLIQSENVKKLINLYKKYGDRLKQQKVSFNFKLHEEFAIVASNIGMEKEKYAPLKNLYNLLYLDNKILTPLDHIKPSHRRKIEKYDRLYAEILKNLYTLRYEKIYPTSSNFEGILSNNVVDAENLIQVFSLNDTYFEDKEYYNLITRDLPAEIFSKYTWSEDPLLSRKVIKGKGLPLSRYTQYLFYSVYIDNNFERDNVEGIERFIEKLRVIFMDSFNNIINLINKHLPLEYISEITPTYQRQNDRMRIKRKIADTINRYFEIDLEDSNIDIAKYINFAKAIENPDIFEDVMSKAKNQMAEWAVNTKNSLSDYLSQTKDPVLEECIRSLNEMSIKP